ncbi:type II secretion system F family protein, partial [Escherichia coli]|uniref:type II secretion system F family protein n=1 Tax=Escherichia coli TaxID=562 RepID=UPI00201A5F87
QRWSGVPIIAANMDTVGTFSMASALASFDILTAVHKHYSVEEWQALLQSLAHDLEQGVAFSNALLPWSEVFPPLYQAMIRTGELTGKLDE